MVDMVGCAVLGESISTNYANPVTAYYTRPRLADLLVVYRYDLFRPSQLFIRPNIHLLLIPAVFPDFATSPLERNPFQTPLDPRMDARTWCLREPYRLR